MVIWICFMLGNFFWHFGPDTPLRHLFTDTWVELTQLISLSYAVALIIEPVGRFNSPSASRCPNLQWF